MFCSLLIMVASRLSLVYISFVSLTVAVGEIVIYVDGMVGLINCNEMIQWLYQLTTSKVTSSLFATNIVSQCIHPMNDCYVCYTVYDLPPYTRTVQDGHQDCTGYSVAVCEFQREWRGGGGCRGTHRVPWLVRGEQHGTATVWGGWDPLGEERSVSIDWWSIWKSIVIIVSIPFSIPPPRHFLSSLLSSSLLSFLHFSLSSLSSLPFSLSPSPGIEPWSLFLNLISEKSTHDGEIQAKTMTLINRVSQSVE